MTSPRIRSTFLAAIVSALLLCDTASAASFANGGFESGALEPWFQDRLISGTEDWNVSDANPRSGGFSATNVGNIELRQDFDPIPGALVSELSFWLVSPFGFAYVLFYSDGSSVQTTIQTGTGEDWVFYDVTSEVDGQKQLSGFSLFGNRLSRTFLDDVVITSAPEPATGLLLGLGLVLARGLGRRASPALLPQRSPACDVSTPGPQDRA